MEHLGGQRREWFQCSVAFCQISFSGAVREGCLCLLYLYSFLISRPVENEWVFGLPFRSEDSYGADSVEYEHMIEGLGRAVVQILEFLNHDDRAGVGYHVKPTLAPLYTLHCLFIMNDEAAQHQP